MRALWMLPLLVTLTTTAWAQAPARPSPLQLAEQLGACLGREDPTCAEPALAALQREAPGSTTVAYSQGVSEFLAGRLDLAHTTLQRVAGSALAPTAVRERAQSYLDLVDSTAEVHAGTQAHKIAGGRVVVYLRPGPDEVLLPWLERVLAKALPKMEAAFGRVQGGPIAVYVYPRLSDLGRVSGLTVEQIRTSGTIALCKYNRVMITSPADLVFGYDWADTIAHELVHWFIIKHGGAEVPIWLHEGLARAFEGAWRDADPLALDRDERQTLLGARKKSHFITLARMSPSMALLPSQEDTQLAFAEVHHAAGWLLRHAAKEGDGTALAAAGQAGRLIGYFGSGMGEADALTRFAQLTPAGFATAWRRDLQKAELHLGERGPGDALRPRPKRLVFRGAGPGGGGLHEVGAEAKRFAELGDRLAVLKRPLAAAIEYRKAIAAGGTDGPLLVARLGRVLLDLGKTAEAMEYLEPALQDHPDHAPLHILVGRARVLLGQYREALDALDMAALLNPYDPELHGLASQAFAALGQPGDAAAAKARELLVGGTTP